MKYFILFITVNLPGCQTIDAILYNYLEYCKFISESVEEYDSCLKNNYKEVRRLDE